MLRVFLFSFSLFLTHTVYAQTCDELTDNLLAIENQLKSTKLNKCSQENTKYCCNEAEDPDTCKNLFEAEIEYNKALADVNMHESLIALGQAIEANHYALRKISPKQLNDAQKKVEDFELNFKKAELISSSFDFITKDKSGKNLWVDYKGETSGDLYNHLKSKCKDKDYENFCKKYENILKEKSVDQTSILETLNNFALTDKKLNYDLTDRKNQYVKYQDYLKINTTGKDPQTIEDFKASNSYKSIERLKELISKYNTTPSEELGKEILVKSKELEKLSVNFNSGVTPRESFKKNVADALGKDIRNVSTVSSLLLNKDLVKKNFSTTKQMMNDDSKKLEKDLEQKVKKATYLAGKCDLKNNNESIDQCISKLCGTKSINEACNQTDENRPLFAKGFQNIIDDARRAKNSSYLSKFHDALKGCLDSETSLESFQCIKEQQNKMEGLISDNLTEAKKNLTKKANILNHLKSGEPIKKLRFQKYLGVAALEKNNCVKDEQRKTSEPISSFCSTPNLDGHISSALELSSSIGDIIVSYDRKKLTGFYKGLYGQDQNFDDYLNKLNESCSDTNESTKIKYICEFYQGKKKEQVRKKQEAIKKAQIKKLRRENEVEALREKYGMNEYTSKKSEMSGAGYAAAGLLQGVTQSIPSIFGMMAQKRTHKRQMEYYNKLYSYQQTMYAPTTTHNTNWINWDFSGTNPTDFNSTGLKYYDTNQLNFGINPIPFSYTANDGGIYIPTSTTGTTETGFSF